MSLRSYDSSGNGARVAGEAPATGERGYRRKRLAAMAGSLYSRGATAVSEIRDSYAQSRNTSFDPLELDQQMSIPGAFPDVKITVHRGDHMVLFPCYAKRHIKKDWDSSPAPSPLGDPSLGYDRDEEYRRLEWERMQDESAVVDVDVRGWIYSPHKGPMTRRNRLLIGLARQLSGIPRPDRMGTASGDLAYGSYQETQEYLRDQHNIEERAAEIERIGQEEKRMASQGLYSEDPSFDGAKSYGEVSSRPGRRISTPTSTPHSPTLGPTQGPGATPATSDLADMDLAVANANLMARVAPFMTTPLVELPITLFFYNESKSQSRTVTTDYSGHFITRAALSFVPTHVRVLANENLTAIQEVTVTEPTGVSLISDVDDTIKQSNISGGAKEIFRNTFVRDLKDLTIDGVKEWYHTMDSMGVSIHYCSNSPWQLFPVLSSFFTSAGLPTGSLHLKQYNGMLQGIFEPVAERKKDTLERILKDFPMRRFLLVGDSGEADLEVYTELAIAHPGRILAIFIRDVTTPESPTFFASSYETTKKSSTTESSDSPSSRPTLPPRNAVPSPPEPPQAKPRTAIQDLASLQFPAPRPDPSQPNESGGVHSRSIPPPRPAKPAALRSISIDGTSSTGGRQPQSGTGSKVAPVPPPPRARKPVAGDRALPHPLSQSQHSWVPNDSQMSRTVPSRGSSPSLASLRSTATPPPPPPRRRTTPNLEQLQRPAASSNTDHDASPSPLSEAPSTGPSYPNPLGRTATTASTPPNGNAGPMQKKVDLWLRRLARAREILDTQGVSLYTWRRGEDVIEEAVGIVSAEKDRVGKS